MPSREQSEALAIELSRHGLRATRQRLAVLSFLRAARNHPSAIAIHRSIARRQPQISRKTVYEVLDAFVRAGLASVITEGGEPYRYEANTSPHHHARCRVCDRIFDLPAGANGRLRSNTALPEGFDVESVSVTFRGLCRRCRDEI